MKSLTTRIFRNKFLNILNKNKHFLNCTSKNFNILVGKENNCYKFNLKINKKIDNEFLTEDQKSIQDAAYNFANNELFPNAAEWDAKKHFPKDIYRKAAELGFACKLKK